MVKRKTKEMTLTFAAFSFNMQLPIAAMILYPIQIDFRGYLIPTLYPVFWGILILVLFVLYRFYKSANEVIEKYYPNNWLVKFLFVASNPNNSLKVKDQDFPSYLLVFSILNFICPIASLVKYLYFSAKSIYISLYGLTKQR